MKELHKSYNPKETEDRIYKMWEESGYFTPENLPQAAKREPFSMVMPPPNVTGILHAGHALMLTIEDIIIRYQRMRGKKTLWLPGTDHAAIATQAKVEAELYKKEKKTRHDLGREEFLKLVEQYAKDSHDTIVNQVKKMGSSCDWDREAYTLDEKRTKAVYTAFEKMYKAGLIYRGERIVNWDPKLQTTVSDDEIEWREEKTPLYYFKYGPFTIATARPETKFGDKYVVMHPDDTRYKEYEDGQQIEVDWINGKVTATIIKDEVIDPEFGTGVMTITPWHDTTDFEIAQRHGLDFEQIIDYRGLLLPVAGELAGQHIKKARPLIVEKLKTMGLLAKVDENYTHRIATNSRGGGLIEPQIMKQWFIDVDKIFPMPHSNIPGIKTGEEVTLKQLMRRVVESGQIKIIPEHFTKIYYHWIDNLRDWCISRQIWYGHRIPAYYDFSESQNEDTIIVNFDIDDSPLTIPTPQLDDFVSGMKSKNYTAWYNDEKTSSLIAASAGNLNELVEKKILTWKNIKSKKYLITHNSSRYPVVTDQLLDTDQNSIFRDPDTLDTWFSSGLWTFSTLGWPDNTEDLNTYHPTDVLETGYDILFFWVARMILMTTYLLGDIPFRTVYLHGLVRDKDRQKMSKSKGNIIDPLGIIDTYGTDALRMALVFNTSPGTDIPLSEDKVKGMKHFANKLWNIARFIMMNLKDANTKIQEAKLEAKTEADKTILEKLNQTIKNVTENLEDFKLHEAAQNIYQFTWYEFADIYLEASKAQLQNDKQKENTQKILLYTLQNVLKLLHPFMPFVTEEIYQKLQNEKLLMVADWPTISQTSHT